MLPYACTFLLLTSAWQSTKSASTSAEGISSTRVSNARPYAEKPDCVEQANHAPISLSFRSAGHVPRGSFSTVSS